MILTWMRLEPELQTEEIDIKSERDAVSVTLKLEKLPNEAEIATVILLKCVAAT